MFIFHKTEVLTVILRCLTGLTYYWFKSYDTKRKYFYFFFFCDFVQKQMFATFTFFCVFVFFVITFVPIKNQTHLAPQNDRLDLSIVKDKHVAGQKMARYGLKKAIYQLPFFRTSPNLHGASGYI